MALGPITTPPNLPSATGQADLSPATFASSLIIEELGSAPSKAPRIVTLQGPSLPHQGAVWGGQNSLVTEWFPGNGDEASQQNLGPREAPSAWQGEWNRTLMGKSPTNAFDGTNIITVVDPDTLVNLLEDMFRCGQRLRATWSLSSSNQDASVSGKKVREGRAKSWSFKYTRLQDIAWEINFEWQSRGKRSQTVTSVRDGSISAGSAALNVSIANMVSAITTASQLASNANILNSATSLSLGQLEAMANAPTAFVQQVQQQIESVQSKVQQVANIAETLASQPINVESAVINTAKNAIAAANQFVDNMSYIPVEQKTVNNTVADMLRAHSYYGSVEDATTQSAAAAQTLVTQLQRKAPPAIGAGRLPSQATPAAAGDVIAIYVCKDGDTPQRISQQFYGSPDHAVDILQANRMPWSQPTFPKGKALIIPQLRSVQPAA